MPRLDETTGLKVCSMCKVEKQACEYNKATREPDGLRNRCRECQREYNRRYRERNRAELRKKSNEYYYANKDLIKERTADYRREYSRRPEVRDRDNRLQRERRKNGSPEYKRFLKERERQEYLRHRQAYVERAARWRKNNPEKYRAIQRSMTHRRRAMKAENGVFKVTTKELQRLLGGVCYLCGEHPAEHIDHIIPIARGGRHSIGNLAGSCASCNLRKFTSFVVEHKQRLFKEVA